MKMRGRYALVVGLCIGAATAVTAIALGSPGSGFVATILGTRASLAQSVHLNITHRVRLVDILKLNHGLTLSHFDQPRDWRVRFYDFLNCLHDFSRFIRFSRARDW